MLLAQIGDDGRPEQGDLGRADDPDGAHNSSDCDAVPVKSALLKGQLSEVSR